MIFRQECNNEKVSYELLRTSISTSDDESDVERGHKKNFGSRRFSLLDKSIRLIRYDVSLWKATLLTLFLIAIYSLAFTSKEQHRNAKQSFKAAKGTKTSIWAYQGESIVDKRFCHTLRTKLASSSIPIERHSTHRAAAIGKLDFFTSQPTCLTYKDRISPYTDIALGFTYRNIKNTDEQVKIDPLRGPEKPKSFTKNQWTSYLKTRNVLINSEISDETLARIPDWKALSDGCGLEDTVQAPKESIRTAVLFRFYEDYVLTEDQVLDLRAMLSEMIINRPSDGWDIRLLVEVKETKGALVSKELQEQVLMPMIPREFWGLVEFWSESLETVVFPGIAPQVGYGNKNSCLLAAQLFSHFHPEYDFYYNWEADLRFLGNYSVFFDKVQEYSRNEPTSKDLYRYQKWQINGLPPKIKHNTDERSGIGKEADLITFNAILDVNGSHWLHEDQFINYGVDVPRRTSTVSSIRFSRNLVRAMKFATIENQKAMECEAWPATVVLHSHLEPSSDQTFNDRLAKEVGESMPFKGVYVPHPVYLSQDWDPRVIEKKINGPEYFLHESFLASSTFNWMSGLPGDIYSKWMRGDGQDSCRQPALMHPIKEVGY